MIFEYTTPSSLKEEGVTEYSDDKLRKLIRMYSSRINKLIGHSFVPSPLEFSSLPSSGDLYRLPGPKVIEVLSASYGYSDLSRTPLDNLSIAIEGNLINLDSRGLRRPVGVNFRYLSAEMINEKRVKVRTLDKIQDGTTQFKVNSAENLSVRDVLQTDKNCFIIKEIDYDQNIITIDEAYQIPRLPVNTELSCYGQVPYEIEEAVILFIKHHKTSQKSSGRMKSEKIGDYSYEVFEGKNSISGNSEIDNLLSGFMKDNIGLFYL